MRSVLRQQRPVVLVVFVVPTSLASLSHGSNLAGAAITWTRTVYHVRFPDATTTVRRARHDNHNNGLLNLVSQSQSQSQKSVRCRCFTTHATDDNGRGGHRGRQNTAAAAAAAAAADAVVAVALSSRPSQLLHSNNNNNNRHGPSLEDLRRKTRQLLLLSSSSRRQSPLPVDPRRCSPVGFEGENDPIPPSSLWTPKDVSKARFLMEQWSAFFVAGRSIQAPSGSDCCWEEVATHQSDILTAWLQQRLEGDNNNNNNPHLTKGDDPELLQLLHRCLDSWRRAVLREDATTGDNNNNTPPKSRRHRVATREAMRLVNLFRDASHQVNEIALRPNRKTYSMLLNVLAEHPQSPTAVRDVMSVFDTARGQEKLLLLPLDLQFYNVCLHTLAECSPYHCDAPTLAESIYRELSERSCSTDNIVAAPDSASLACLLRSYAAGSSSLPGSSAARAESVLLDQMMLMTASSKSSSSSSSFHPIVNVTCFNVCIDAWAKDGSSPDRAEALLRRMMTTMPATTKASSSSFPLPRPNAVSFNSAINAWAKRSSSCGRRPDAAASRAEALLEEMEAYGCSPTVESFASVMEAWAATPDPGEKVQRLLDNLERMYAEGHLDLPPSKVCYLIAIQAWGRTTTTAAAYYKPAGNDSTVAPTPPAERAEMLLRRMQRMSAADSDDGGGSGQRRDLEPCVVIYTALIRALGGRNHRGGTTDEDDDDDDDATAPDRALAIYREMQQLARSGRGRAVVAPNTVTLNALLGVFASHGRATEARRLLQRDGRLRTRPDLTSYHILLSAYARSRADNAAEEAQEVVDELERSARSRGGDDTVRPTVQTYSHLLVAWGNHRGHDAADRAEEVFWRLFRLNDDDDDAAVRPNTALFNCVLRAWAKSSEGGAAERAEAFFTKVQREGAARGEDIICPDAVSHLHLIQAWAHSRRRKAHLRAENHLEDAKTISSLEDSSGMKLTRAHFNGVILAWSKSRAKDALLHVQRHMDDMRSLHERGYDTSPDHTTVHLYVKTILESGGKDRSNLAAKAINELKRDGKIVSQATLDLLRNVSA